MREGGGSFLRGVRVGRAVVETRTASGLFRRLHRGPNLVHYYRVVFILDWLSSDSTLAQVRVGVMHRVEHDLVRFLFAPMSERAPLAHDKKAALGQHTNRRRVVARSASVRGDGLPPPARTLVEHEWQCRGPNVHGRSNR